jgi:hypothetical protein
MSARDRYPEPEGMHPAQYDQTCDEIDRLEREVTEWRMLAETGPNIEGQTAEIVRLRNALKWIRQSAMVHFLGDAFDPVHMEELANQANDALEGEPVDDFDEVMARAKVKAREWAKAFSIDANDPRD